jgi:N-acetylneuraminic acid mutarotase
MLAHGGRFYLFGGLSDRYGRPKHAGDMSTLGTLNDLWVFDPAAGEWENLEPDDDAHGLEPVGDRFYLLGGQCAVKTGWGSTAEAPTMALNDLWSYSPRERKWTLLESDDGRSLRDPSSSDGDRPTVLAAPCMAVLGSHIYLFGGFSLWPQVFSNQLWRYDTGAGRWERLGPEPGSGAPWPRKRYATPLIGWEGKLYLFGGRDLEDGVFSFFNDIWQYDPAKGAWDLIQENRPDDPRVPSPRYALGHGLVDGRWYFFGGFGSQGITPQLNDLWCYDLRSGRWTEVQVHDGSKDYSANAVRPGVRRIPTYVELGGALYFFGGVDFGSGPDDDGPTAVFNDFWRGRPSGE